MNSESWKTNISKLKDFFTSEAAIISLVTAGLFFSSSVNLLYSDRLGIDPILVALFNILFIICESYLLYTIRATFNFWLYVKIGASYLIYLLLSYFLYATQNINNVAFDYLDISKVFRENGYTFNLFLILGLTLVFFFFDKYLKKSAFFLKSQVSTRENFFISQIMVSLFVTDTKFKSLLNTSSFLKVEQENLVHSLFSFAFLFILFSFLSYLFVKGISDLFRYRASLSSAFTISLLMAIIFNYTIQLGILLKGALLNRYIFPGATAFQILILTLLFFTIYLLINKFLISTYLSLIIGTILSIVNYVKFTMRGEPLLLSDFKWLKQFDLVLSFVSMTYIFYAFLFLCFLVITYIYLRKKVFYQPITDSWKRRLTGIIAVFATLLIITGALQTDKNKKIMDGVPVLSTLNNFNDVSWMGHATNARMKSLVYVWFKQATTPIMEKPSNYSKENIEKVYQKYTKLAAEINKSREQNIEDQTVIYVLSESLANPDRIDGVTLSKDVMSNITRVQEKTTSGLMKSDGYGGGTGNMEFQSLTGLPMYNMSTGVATLYTEVVPQMKVIPSISDQFASADRYAVHLGDAKTYSRADVYKKLGFDHFIAAAGTDEKASNIKKVGLFPSDASTYENVLAKINDKKSQFFSVITYQNHVPWLYGKPETVSGTGDQFSDAENSQLSNYARLLYQTDIETKDFLDKLSRINKNITVVFYGDHLPGFYPNSAFQNNPESQYQTDYFIWNNKKNTKLNYPYVNSSDFTAVLLAATDSKVTPYQALLTQVLNYASVDKKELTAKQKEIADDLKLIEYDIISGRNYISTTKHFFNKDN